MGSFSVLVKSLQQCINLKKKKKIFMARQVTRPSGELGNLTSIHKTASSKIIRHPICLDFYFSTTFFLDFYFSTTRSKSKKTLRMRILILCIFPNWWLLPLLATFSTNTAESVTRWLMGRSSNYHSFEAWKPFYWWLTLVIFLPSPSILSFIKLGYSTSICTCVHPVYDEVLS